VQVTLVAVGRLRPALRAAADEYLQRLRRYGDIRELEVRAVGNAATPAEGCRREAARLRELLPVGGHVVALDREGRAWSSEQLAARLDQWLRGARPLSFVIGGSHGLDPALLADAHERWSLGPLTLPHQLARVVVTEQLYRAWTILRREPYHK
jgi:23S rRNA (pseudouridine1915-N3)-methyltransferase